MTFNSVVKKDPISMVCSSTHINSNDISKISLVTTVILRNTMVIIESSLRNCVIKWFSDFPASKIKHVVMKMKK